MAAIHWKGAVNGTWRTATGWSAGAVPASTDDVTIGATGTCTVTINNAASTESLTITGATAAEIA